MKVAQYEVLGSRSKRTTRPGRDDRPLLPLVKPHTREQEPKRFYRPSDGTGLSFAPFPSTEVLGYFHWVPPGRVLFAYF